MSNPSAVSSDQCVVVFLVPRYNSLLVGLQPENIISVIHNIDSIHLYIILETPPPHLAVSCDGAPAGHLTSVGLYYFSVVWSKMVPPVGIVTRDPSSPHPAPPCALEHSGGFLR